MLAGCFCLGSVALSPIFAAELEVVLGFLGILIFALGVLK